VYQEDFALQSGVGTELVAYAGMLFDPSFLRDNINDPSDAVDTWLPLVDNNGKAAGRIRVRTSIFQGPPGSTSGRW